MRAFSLTTPTIDWFGFDANAPVSDSDGNALTVSWCIYLAIDIVVVYWSHADSVHMARAFARNKIDSRRIMCVWDYFVGIQCFGFSFQIHCACAEAHGLIA